MKLTNPEGKKTITLKDKEHQDIVLEDFDTGSRSFELQVILQGRNASCTITGRAKTNGKDKKSWHVTQTYEGETQQGRIDLRGTAEDESLLQFDGRGVLSQKSKQADATISEKIMLFDKARAKSLPVLTVKTDDVAAASHGASVAPVDRQQILYLQSRGITRKEAQSMLREGFLKF